jgi:hypothetical protein
MKTFNFAMLLLLLLIPPVCLADGMDDVVLQLKQGASQQLQKQFADNVEVTINDDDHVYNKAESLPALDKFFADNRPQAAKLFHKINSSAKFLYGVVMLTTDKGVYRVSLTMNNTSGTMKIIELRIEPEKTK